MKRIALDVDGLVADFTQAVIDKACSMGLKDHFPCCSAHADRYRISDLFHSHVWEVIIDDIDFWLNIPPYPVPNFPVVAYCTNRPISSEITAEWLMKNGMPEAPVLTTPANPRNGEPIGRYKAELLRDFDVDMFVEDNFRNFLEMNEEGIRTYLLSRPWNMEHDAGDLRIESLDDLLPLIE